MRNDGNCLQIQMVALWLICNLGVEKQIFFSLPCNLHSLLLKTMEIMPLEGTAVFTPRTLLLTNTTSLGSHLSSDDPLSYSHRCCCKCLIEVFLVPNTKALWEGVEVDSVVPKMAPTLSTLEIRAA